MPEVGQAICRGGKSGFQKEGRDYLKLKQQARAFENAPRRTAPSIGPVPFRRFPEKCPSGIEFFSECKQPSGSALPRHHERAQHPVAEKGQIEEKIQRFGDVAIGA